MRAVLLLLVLLTAPGGAAAGERLPICGGEPSPYLAALCAYHAGDLERAVEAFRSLVAKDEPRPETLKSRYFLARSLMKLGRWSEASAELIKIYSVSRSFYREWGCDFLLGEARQEEGID